MAVRNKAHMRVPPVDSFVSHVFWSKERLGARFAIRTKRGYNARRQPYYHINNKRGTCVQLRHCKGSSPPFCDGNIAKNYYTKHTKHVCEYTGIQGESRGHPRATIVAKHKNKHISLIKMIRIVHIWKSGKKNVQTKLYSIFGCSAVIPYMPTNLVTVTRQMMQ